jgi:hypothetical protein
MADQPPDQPPKTRIDADLKTGATFLMALLIAIVGFLLRSELASLTASVAATGAKMEAAVQLLNMHSTQLATHDLRIQRLEQQQSNDTRTAVSKGR